MRSALCLRRNTRLPSGTSQFSHHGDVDIHLQISCKPVSEIASRLQLLLSTVEYISFFTWQLKRHIAFPNWATMCESHPACSAEMQCTWLQTSRLYCLIISQGHNRFCFTKWLFIAKREYSVAAWLWHMLLLWCQSLNRKYIGSLKIDWRFL